LLAIGLAKSRFITTLLDDGRFLLVPNSKRCSPTPGVRRKLDPYAVSEYFSYGYVPDPRSIYSGIAKLPPAHTLTLRRGAPVPAPREYWDVKFIAEDGRTEDNIAHDLADRLRSVVAMRMVADVPLGAFLSGGVDSSAIVA